MSYIFSSNGNEYTFKKLDSMLINMPEKDGLHVLVRETKPDGNPVYSWTDAKIIVKVNNAFILDYAPSETTSITDTNIQFNLTKGNFLVTSKLSCYNQDLEDTWKSCVSFEDVLKCEYYIKVHVNSTCILHAKLVDTLSNVYTFTDSCLIENNFEGATITLESNIPNCVFLKNFKSILIVFEELV